MHLSGPFIRRPVATSLLSLALLMAGSVAYSVLPVASLPDVDLPTIGVGSSLPGASPETMASNVAAPLERQFGRIAGVTQMTSSSSLGSTQVNLQFDMNRDIDAAARDVQASINAARGQLPSYLPQNPDYHKANPADGPIFILTLTSDVLSQAQMYDIADTILAQKVAQIRGVGQVFVGGSASPAVRVELNPMQLSAYGVGLEAVRTALGSANANRPKGAFQDADHRWLVNDNDQIFKAQDYKGIIVGYNQATGAPVRVSDLGTVTDGVADIHAAGMTGVNQGPGSVLRPCVMIIIMRVPGANVIATADNVLKALPQLKAQIPPTIKVAVSLDRTTTIRSSVRDVEITLCVSVLLVTLVVFLFLREIWATIIPSVAVPLSLVGTFGVMYLLGYSLDNLSLMALTISTGFVVDDAIVVIENISRYLEQGMSPYDAAIKGSREIGFTVLSMSTSLIAVFIPILLMGGVVGILFREFAMTLSVAIAMSLLVSLTCTPMMCAQFLKTHDPAHRRSSIYRVSERAFVWLADEYAAGLRWVLRHQWLMLGVTIATFALNVYLFIIVPKGLFPQQDTGRMSGATKGAVDISFDSMLTKHRQLAQMVLNDPGVASVTAFVGGSGPDGGGFSVGHMFVSLKPLAQRKISADQIINRLRAKLTSIPGAVLYLQVVQEFQAGARGGDAQYQYTLADENLAELNTWAPKLLARMKTLSALRDSSTDQQNQGKQATLVIDRDSASRLGISTTNIDNVLYDAFGQREVSTMYTALNQYFVVMEVAPQYQSSPDSLNGIFIKSGTGQMVPLSTIAHFTTDVASLQVNHQGQYPSVTLTFNLAPNVALGDAVDQLEQAEQEIGFPSGIHATFQGTAQVFQASLATEPYLFLSAIVTVYIVLGILYESLIHPLTILSTLPSAGVGAILALLLTGTELSIIAAIGILLLIGIVKKNAIMMIDFALQAEREEGLSPVDAIYQACLLRFRPIMMTTMAAIFGALPLVIGLGEGSELRRPLGITIVGGLLVSQMLTLFTTPVVYLFFDRLQWKVMKLKRIGSELDAPPETAASHGD